MSDTRDDSAGPLGSRVEREVRPQTRMQDMPTCPHCGHRHQDAWEWNFGPGMEGDREGKECENCEKVFDCRRDVSVYYTTTIPAA